MNQLTFELIGRCVFWLMGGAFSACLAFAVVLFDSWILKPRREAQFKLGYQEAVSQMSRDSYWFSEHPPTVFLLGKIVRAGVDGSSTGVSQLRDDWRREMEKVDKP